MYLPKNDWNYGTYRELKAILNELPEHYLIRLQPSCCRIVMSTPQWVRLDGLVLPVTC